MKSICLHLLVLGILVSATQAVALPFLASEQFDYEDLSQLDRGHRLHILYGLQTSGWAGKVGADYYNPTWNQSRWEESNLNTPCLKLADESMMLGAPPGDKNWGIWGTPPDSTQELYADTLVLMQYSDESDLADETVFNTTVDMMQEYREDYPQAISFIDLHGSQVRFYTITGDLARFMAEGEPDMVVMNDYLFNGTTTYVKGGTPSELYTSMAILREATLAGHDGAGTRPIPAGQFIQAVTHPEGLLGYVIAESEMNLYIFSSLAFGFKTLTLFRYSPTSASPAGIGDIDTVLFVEPGFDNPTPLFYSTADAMGQAMNLGPALVRLLSTDLRLVPGRLPGGTTVGVPSQLGTWDASADPYITSITAENLGSTNNGNEGSVLVGYFTPLDESFDGPGFTGEQYFMVVNSLSGASASEDATQQRITLSFDFQDSGITQLLKVSRDTGDLEAVPLQSEGGSVYTLELELDGGMGDLFKFDTGAPFVGMDGPWTDSDGDGLTDAWESGSGVYVGQYDLGTSNQTADSDGDGLADGYELNTLGTSPVDADTDGDLLSDGYEVANGYDPLDENSAPPVPSARRIALLALAAVLAAAGLWFSRRLFERSV